MNKDSAAREGAVPAPHRDPTAPLASAGGQPVRSTFLPLVKPWIGDREKELVLEALDSGWITTGPKTHELATRIAALCGASHAVALNSATGALHLGLTAVGVKPGDEVITPTYTFVACVNVIEHVGAKPVLVDIDPETLCVDPAAVAAAITERTAAIMPVDYAGHPCDYDQLCEIASARGVRIVEDAAHALGAAWRGRPIGSIADVTAFSFYATKNLTTGEGGAAVTNDPDIAERIDLLSLHGMNRDAWKRYSDTGSWYYEVTAPGFKYNMSDILAAIGIGQLDRFAEFQARRAAIAARYTAGLADIEQVGTPVVREGATHAWHLYPIHLKLDQLRCDRATFINELRSENIGTSVHFIPIHMHPYFKATLSPRQGAFPHADAAYRGAITLPLFPRMTDEDVDDVCAAVRKIVHHAHR